MRQELRSNADDLIGITVQRIKIELGNDEVVRYFPAKKLPRGQHEVYRRFELQLEDIVNNYEQRDPLFFKALINKDNVGKILTVPAGAARFNWPHATMATDLSSQAPVIKFQQCGEANCSVRALASALVHFGDNDTAQRLMSSEEDILASLQTNSKIASRIHAIIDFLRKRPRKYNPKANHSQFFDESSMLSGVHFAELEDTESNRGHCIAIVIDRNAGESWLFDANLTHAIRLCAENLDWCCSDENNSERKFKCFACIVHLDKL